MSKKPTLYFIPGLAATSFIYHKIGLDDYKCHFFEWEDPQPGDTMTTYAKRLADQVDQTEPFALIGTSLGGMMAVEMNKYCKPEKTFLVSSIEQDTELPWYLRMFRWFQIYWLIPFFLMRWIVNMYRPISGKHKGVELKLVRAMLDESTGKFFRWAIHQVLHWRQREKLDNLYRIHGTNDHMFPLKHTQPVDYKVEGGDHFMVIVRAKEVGEYIRSQLSTLE